MKFVIERHVKLKIVLGIYFGCLTLLNTDDFNSYKIKILINVTIIKNKIFKISGRVLGL